MIGVLGEMYGGQLIYGTTDAEIFEDIYEKNKLEEGSIEEFHDKIGSLELELVRGGV